MKHSTTVGFFPHLVIEGTATSTQIKAADEDQTIILNAEIKVPMADMIGTFGLPDLPYLKGIADFFNKEGTTVKASKVERDGEMVPEEIHYANVDGSSAAYRFMHKSLIKEIKVLRGGVNYDVEFTPRKDKIDEFVQLAGLTSEEQFSVRTEDGMLAFYLGDEDSAGHRVKFVFAEDIEGDIIAGKKWPVKQVLAVLRLASMTNATMKISNRGIITVSIDSGLADYDIIIVATQK